MLKHKINWIISKLSIKSKARNFIIPIVGISCVCVIFGASYKLGSIYSGSSKDKSTTKKLATIKAKPKVKKKKDDNKTVVSQQQTQNAQPVQKPQQNNITNNQQTQNRPNKQNNTDNNKSTNNNLNSANVKTSQSTTQNQGTNTTTTTTNSGQPQGKKQNTNNCGNAQNTADGYSRDQRITQMESQIKYFEDHGDQKDAQWARDQLHAFQGNR